MHSSLSSVHTGEGSFWSSVALVALVVFGQVFGAAAGCSLTGCAGASDIVKTVDELDQPADNVVISNCRKQAREVFDGGAPKSAPLAVREAAFKGYVECTKDGGVR